MTTTFEQLTITVLTSVSLNTALVFLVKSWLTERLKNAIKNEYDQKLETHKAQLKAESDVVIEKLKSSLHVAAIERSIKLTKVFNRQSETIEEAYSQLHMILRGLAQYLGVWTTNSEPLGGEYKILEERITNFHLYYETRKLFFPKTTQILIGKFMGELHNRKAVFTDALGKSPRVDSDRAVFMETFIFLSQDCQKAMNQLDDDMKGIWGLTEGGTERTEEGKKYCLLNAQCSREQRGNWCKPRWLTRLAHPA